MLSEAQLLFKKGDSFDHRQGLGWTWILQADLANARLVDREPDEVIEMATRALDILLPIENWPGVARVYAARATVYEKLGNEEQAAQDPPRAENSREQDRPGVRHGRIKLMVYEFLRLTYQPQIGTLSELAPRMHAGGSRL